jgi:hypothetical protein
MKDYWKYVKADLKGIEDELNDPMITEKARTMNPQQWFEFLLNKYYRWKFTDPRRYSRWSGLLKKHVDSGGLRDLYETKREIFAFVKTDTESGLRFASRRDRAKVGLGIAAGSGLLSVLFPEYFGTVDEFVVIGLGKVDGLLDRWRNEITRINQRLQKSKSTKNGSFQLSLSEGVLLVEIMRAKAHQLNEWFGCNAWTPRKVDMVLWGSRSEGGAYGCR